MKIKCVLVISSLVFFILKTNISYSQDTTQIVFPKESALKKGNYALVFEVGTIFGYQNFFEAFSLTAKKHLTDKIALRLSFGGDFSMKNGYTENNGSYSGNPNSPSDYYEDYFQTSINLQYFMNVNSKIKPFFSFGPYAEYSYYGHSDKVYYHKSEEWGIGIFASLGLEMFITDNISLIGEYIMKSTYGKRLYQNIGETPSDYYYEFDTQYKLKLNTARLGFSVYF